MIVGILIPICIAGFFGYIFGSVGGQHEAGKLPIALVDEDGSTVIEAIVADISGDAMLDVVILTRAEAEEQVRKGSRNAAAVFPQGFGEQSVAAMFSGGARPKVDLLVDPSQPMSSRIIEGLLAQYAMRDISREAINGAMGRPRRTGIWRELEAGGDTQLNDTLRTLLLSARKLNDMNATRQDRDGAAGGGFEFSIPYEVSSTRSPRATTCRTTATRMPSPA